MAIQVTLNSVMEENKKHDIDTTLIYCDGQSAVGILQLGWDNKNLKTAMDIQQSLIMLEENGVYVMLQWSPEHANIQGNEITDSLAKETAKEAKEMTDDAGIATQTVVISAARESVETRWQRR